jgi:hypothetical protein
MTTDMRPINAPRMGGGRRQPFVSDPSHHSRGTAPIMGMTNCYCRMRHGLLRKKMISNRCIAQLCCDDRNANRTQFAEGYILTKSLSVKGL